MSHISETRLFSSAPHNSESGGKLSEKRNARILSMIHRMTIFYESMVDTSTNRFFLICRPAAGERIHDHCPLRELGCAWDAATALHTLSSHGIEMNNLGKESEKEDTFQLLRDAVSETVKQYSVFDEHPNFNDDDSTSLASLHGNVLRETPNIAHSGLFLLSFIGATRLNRMPSPSADVPTKELDALVRGILDMQLPSGAFRTHFDSPDDILRGIAFYPGEAMTALMEAFTTPSSERLISENTKNRILPAMTTALKFYRDLYRAGGMDINFNVWQIQAFARLFLALRRRGCGKHERIKQESAEYVLKLCQDVSVSSSWRILSRGQSFFPNLQTVEIVCGLDALAQGIRVGSLLVNESGDDVVTKDLLSLFTRSADNALDFVEWSLDRIETSADAHASPMGSGGLGFGGVQVMEQRLDVTGHAIAALTKLVAS